MKVNIFTICLTTIFGSFCDVCASGKIDLKNGSDIKEFSFVNNVYKLHKKNFQEQIFEVVGIVGVASKQIDLPSRIRNFIAGAKDTNAHRGFNQEKLLKVLNQFDEDYKELENEIKSEEQKFDEVQKELNSIRGQYESPNLIKTIDVFKSLNNNFISLCQCIRDYDENKNSWVPVYGYANNTFDLYWNYFLSPNESIRQLIEKKDEIMKIIDSTQEYINNAKQQIQDAKNAMEQYKSITQNRQGCDDKMIFDGYKAIRLVCKNICPTWQEYQSAKMNIEYIKRTNKSYNEKYKILKLSIGGPVRKALSDGYKEFLCLANIDREFIQKSLPKIEASKPKDSST